MNKWLLNITFFIPSNDEDFIEPCPSQLFIVKTFYKKIQVPQKLTNKLY